ncbi:MAG: DNA polymerase IV [Kiritimatiellae bacterium]|nr:DNA polymerase IV [Kiritimatiellia bacterium]
MKINPDDNPLTLELFPTAILHVDADAFFTSVEQAVHPRLKGRPVVSGKERGIIACASYEAKALGIHRGVSLWEAKKRCPDLVVLPSDYETYSVYSKRMFDILRRYTPVVEEYSIDEAFADLSGMRRIFRCSYEKIARRMQSEIQQELDLSVSVGVSLTKSLAKLGSDFRKPHGITAVAGCHIHLFLQRIQLDEVWGFGPNSVNLLRKYGLRTAADFIQQPEIWARKMLGKPGVDIWNELRGTCVQPVTNETKHARLSIGKSKTFTTPSAERDFVHAKLLRNLESAFIKLRRHQLQAREITIVLREKNYRQDALTSRLNRPTSATHEAVTLVNQLFAQLYRPDTLYRTTQIVLSSLSPASTRQYELFEDPLCIEKCLHASELIDEINHRFGKHKIGLGTALFLDQHPETDRDAPAWRKQHLLLGETARKRLAIPRLDIALSDGPTPSPTDG